MAGVAGIGDFQGNVMIFILSAFSLWISSAYAFANPRIRNLEEEIPDAFPDEPEEIEDVVGDEDVCPVAQLSTRLIHAR